MKRKTALSLLLALALFGSMSFFPAKSQAQPRLRKRADTGAVTLGMGQILRITISSEGFEDGKPGEGSLCPEEAYVHRLQ